MAGCKTTDLKIDPCQVYAEDTFQCHAVPINQPDKQEYDRSVLPLDVCLTIDDYATLQKYVRSLRNQCEVKVE